VRERSAHKTVLLVWSIVMLMAVLGQRRFGYYFAINAALLTGYFSWKMLDLAGLSRLLSKPREAATTVREFRKRKKKAAGSSRARTRSLMQTRGVWLRVIAVGIAIFFLVVFPSIGPTRPDGRVRTLRITTAGGVTQIPASGMAKELAGMPNFVIDEWWYTSLTWLRENSPEPFGDADYYYALYPPRDEFEYPDSAYGVMSWWDYGYFITRIGRRLPNANPTQAGARQAGRYFTAQDEASANEQLDALDSRYVVIDYTMPTGKFYAMVEWADKSVADFHAAYYVPISAKALQQVTLYYPPYYQSAVAGLYNFGGKSAAPSGNSTIAIAWESIAGHELLRQGYREIVISADRAVMIDRTRRYGVIMDHKFFVDYDDAQAYVSSGTWANHAVGGLNPFATIVPLEGLERYVLVHETASRIQMYDQTLPHIRIFEYLDHAGS